jgi:hypothetical protein
LCFAVSNDPNGGNIVDANNLFVLNQKPKRPVHH